MSSTVDKIKKTFIIGFIMVGAALLTYTLVWTLQLQHHIIPVEEREADSYIQRLASRKRVKSIRDHFHNIVEAEPSSLEMETVCFLCHTTLPHHKNKKVRAMLNMHTYFLTCESCHSKSEEGAKVEYAWMDPEGVDGSEGHYGTRYHAISGSLLRVNLQSRVTPCEVQNGQLRFLVQKMDTPLAQDYLRMKDNLKDEEKDFVKKKFHEGIKPVGHLCKECHNKESRLDFDQLGFSEKRRADLESLSVSGMLTRYETFYLPALFD